MKTMSIIREKDIHANKDAYNSSAKRYVVAQYLREDGTYVPCLLTIAALDEGLARVKNNKEDILTVGWVMRLVHYFFNW